MTTLAEVKGPIEQRLDALEAYLNRNQAIMEDIIKIMEGRAGIRSRRPRHLAVVEPNNP